MVVFWVRLSLVFSLPSVQQYLPLASYSTMCFHYVFILHFGFFFLSESSKFCNCSGDLFGASLHVEKSQIKLQRSYLKKKELVIEVCFFSEKFLNIFTSLFLSSWLSFSDPRALCLQLVEHDPPFPYLFSPLLSFASDPIETSNPKSLRF